MHSLRVNEFLCAAMSFPFMIYDIYKYSVHISKVAAIK